MKYLFLLLLLPSVLMAQHRPRFERLNDGWVEMGKSDSITQYIDPTSIRSFHSYRTMVSRLVIHRKNSPIIDNIAQLVHDCADSTYGVIRAIRKVDGHVVFAMDKGETRDITWIKVEPNTFIDIQAKYLCKEPPRRK